MHPPHREYLDNQKGPNRQAASTVAKQKKYLGSAKEAPHSPHDHNIYKAAAISNSCSPVPVPVPSQVATANTPGETCDSCTGVRFQPRLVRIHIGRVSSYPSEQVKKCVRHKPSPGPTVAPASPPPDEVRAADDPTPRLGRQAYLNPFRSARMFSGTNSVGITVV